MRGIGCRWRSSHERYRVQVVVIGEDLKRERVLHTSSASMATGKYPSIMH